jgi:hypothetical protein
MRQGDTLFSWQWQQASPTGIYFYVHKGIASGAKAVIPLVMSHIPLRCLMVWYNYCECTSNNWEQKRPKNSSFNHEPGQVIDKFPNYNMKILLGNFRELFGITSGYQASCLHKYDDQDRSDHLPWSICKV